MTSKPSTPSYAEGFSLVELLVAMTVMLAISGAALSLSLSSRDLFQRDEVRTRLSQSLRAGIDFIGTDTRQAGERLPDDFPALEIIDGADGNPDTIVLRRNLLDVVLPVCADVATNAPRIVIADGSGTPAPGCAPLADEDGDGLVDNLGAWAAMRQSVGGQVRAYIYNPTTRNGEFFTYVRENAALLAVGRRVGERFALTYRAVDQCRLYILEERRYELTDGVLQLVIGGQNGSAMRIADGIIGLQARALFQDGTEQASLGPADLWSQLRSIEVAITARVDSRGGPIERSLSTEFFPRNVLSR